MRELTEQILQWQAAGTCFAVASIIGVTGSAPRPIGAAMAVDEYGTAVGSVSGGCVESAVYDLCREALHTGVPQRETFGYSDSDAFAVGLTCGGVLEVFVHPVGSRDQQALTTALRAEGPVALVRDMSTGETLAVGPDWVSGSGGSDTGHPALRATDVMQGAASRDVLDGWLVPHGAPGECAKVAADAGRPAGVDRKVRPDNVVGTTRSAPASTLVADPEHHSGGPVAAADPSVVSQARAMLESGASGVRVIGCGAREVTVFVESSVPPPRMIVFGAIDFAAAVARIGKFLGYHVTVCDARPVFATAARFPDADEVVVDWPHRYLEGTQLDSRTVICVLTHDAKFDVPVLEIALRRRVAYVGAMGSRRTHRDRLAQLRAAGVAESELSHLHSPIGLDLGGHTPEETAVAVAAEIIAIRYGGSGRELRAIDTAIHHTDAECCTDVVRWVGLVS
jgi:xanthine dehydrogenase accessory factor